ncbi:rho GTPase-activating protein 5-like [Rhododendron vialii]|uniref:rho GTPase-activating protein 5-like n=1 Tax=Rhododendron vialii TaxID=182163 RepID=UPI00265FD01B|nr:rho GTPase-activating protein 5-like [Rhododendron vialii]
MTRLFRSKSCVVRRSVGSMFNVSSPTPSLYLPRGSKGEDEDEDEEEEGGKDDNEEEEEEEEYPADSPVTTPFIGPEYRYNINNHRERVESENDHHHHEQHQPILDILAAVLKKSLVTCTTSVEMEEEVMDIGCPTDVRHVSHVTFDPFNGFLGLPLDLQPQLPPKVPSASLSVFGVSPNSMHCSHDQRGNSVPTILLMMQKRLYSERGLEAEGIFRINAENSKEEYARNQLNKGIVARGIDVHCLAGLIKAWFRELPAGVLDSLTPEQVMHCNSEEECTELVKLLPPTEAALLDWAINLMADVVQYETQNKMNARNISMVFAPNMTQMADPLTALIHAVQVMNFLKTLINKTLGEREESAAHSHPSNLRMGLSRGQTSDGCSIEGHAVGYPFSSTTLDRLESDGMEESGVARVKMMPKRGMNQFQTKALLSWAKGEIRKMV